MKPATLLAAALALAAAVPVSAQEPAEFRTGAEVGAMAHLPGVAGDYFALDSRPVGRRFHVFVRLPEAYLSEPERRFPVSYVLDGDSLFPVLAPAHQFLTYDEGVPQAIVVGIAYGGFDPAINKREIDFRPRLEDGSPGGSAAFLAMLESELIPAIERRYRADPGRRTLFGQSRGGAFVLYAANERPALFHGYVASNPGREWDKHLYGIDRAPAERRTGGTLVVASGTRDYDYLREGALEWASRIAGRSDLPWTPVFVSIEGGTHSASVTQAYRAGMLRVFGLPGGG